MLMELSETSPSVVVLAGPNGAGKTTAASALLPKDLEFLNADEIAKALPEYPSRLADLHAGRMLIEELDDRERERKSFAVETTLSGRTLALRIARLRKVGYHFRLIYLWTPDPEFSIRRVASRVLLGGHDVPEETIRRRHESGLKLLFSTFMPLADVWVIYDNADFPGLQPVAHGVGTHVTGILKPQIWDLILGRISHDDENQATRPTLGNP